MNPHMDDQLNPPLRPLNAWLFITSVLFHLCALLVGAYMLARHLWPTS